MITFALNTSAATTKTPTPTITATAAITLVPGIMASTKIWETVSILVFFVAGLGIPGFLLSRCSPDNDVDIAIICQVRFEQVLTTRSQLAPAPCLHFFIPGTSVEYGLRFIIGINCLPPHFAPAQILVVSVGAPFSAVGLSMLGRRPALHTLAEGEKLSTIGFKQVTENKMVVIGFFLYTCCIVVLALLSPVLTHLVIMWFDSTTKPKLSDKSQDLSSTTLNYQRAKSPAKHRWIAELNPFPTA